MGAEKNIIFYDGDCGLCHNWIKFVIPRDKKAFFYFSPIEGESLIELIGTEEKSSLPDSIIVRTSSGQLLSKTEAVVFMLRNIGGFWGTLAGIIDLLPKVLSNLVYDLIAKIRKKLFAKPEDACPTMPDELRERFLP